MKKIICVTLAVLMLLCTACYPTGEEMVNSIEEIDLFEMNKSDNENITFDLHCTNSIFTKIFLMITTALSH